jgi:hypothetical protein
MAKFWKRARNFLFGKDDIEIFEGNKGGHSYLLLYDTTKKEVIGQYVSPPTKQSKSVGVDGGYAGAIVGFNYQSSIEYDKSIVVENSNNTTGIKIESLTPTVNEYLRSEGKREIDGLVQTMHVYGLLQ